MKPIVFSEHAETKFAILEEHGFSVSREAVESAVRAADKVELGHRGRRIAQKAIDEKHVLRVIFADLPGEMRVITFYPGRRERYED
ncbi:MAG: DUF4258 domain-containing protein [Syntrophobacteria bacterium]